MQRVVCGYSPTNESTSIGIRFLNTQRETTLGLLIGKNMKVGVVLMRF